MKNKNPKTQPIVVAKVVEADDLIHDYHRMHNLNQATLRTIYGVPSFEVTSRDGRSQDITSFCSMGEEILHPIQDGATYRRKINDHQLTPTLLDIFEGSIRRVEQYGEIGEKTTSYVESCRRTLEVGREVAQSRQEIKRGE